MSHNIIVPFGCSGGPGARPRTRRRRTAGLVAALATGLMLTAAPATQADTVTTTVDVGAYPTGVAITPDGTRAYVTNLFDNTVSVIDTTTNTVTDTIDLGRHRAYEVAITPDGTRAYVTNHGEYGKVSVIDTATNTVTDTVDVGDSPYGVAITPDGTRAYVANEGDDSVSVIDTATNAVTTTIDVDAGLFGPKGMAITPDGTRAYVANGAYAVSVIDTATNTVIGEPISVGSYPRDVAITPDGTRAYVTDNSVEYGGVYVIDTATNTVIDTIKVDEQLYGVAITPDGTRAYAANWGDNDAVFVIDTATNTFTTIDLDATAYALAFTPDGTRAYITNWGDKGTVLVIDRTPALTGTPPAGTVGQLYEYAFTVTGEPDPEVTVTAGTLPDGLTLGADGVLAGTPTAGERFEFAITASNGIGQDSTLPVALDINNVSALTGTPPAGTVGQPYEYAFTITGYPAPDVTVTAGTLPDGLTLGADGVLSGTPTGTGQFAFTITARNGIGDDATLPVVLEITESPALTGAPPAGTVGQPYHHSFTLTGYPAPDVTVTAGALPDGLTLSGQGVLSGTPTSAGMYSFTVTASNGFGENAVLEATLDVGQAPAI
ncbi:YncE family protein, partial [Rhodococcus sp. NPDC049939]|uniref:YncE family protein n=1 Tax=Rhodococcus sp. NPDC049939 TaxID=3155511 RepID=UPI0033F02494